MPYPVSVHKCAIAAAQLIERRPLPANQEAALAHCLNDLNRPNLSRSFWGKHEKNPIHIYLLISYIVH